MESKPLSEADLNEYQKLVVLGKQGKLWTIELVYQLDKKVIVSTHRNLLSSKIMDLRGSLFSHGYLIPVGEGHWKVIPPMDYISIDIYRQSAYFGE